MRSFVGHKALGLSMFPTAWRPPFVVLGATAFDTWAKDPTGSGEEMDALASTISEISLTWQDDWPRGIILRSSADDETLDDRGANSSIRLAADYGPANVRDAIESLFRSYAARMVAGRMAVIVQALVAEGISGHLSNERRVSKTINQWLWERLAPDIDHDRFNSQRGKAPDTFRPLLTAPHALIKTFQNVGRWSTQLGRGPVHLEWAHDGRALWLLQMDFELERSDDGINPTAWLRKADHLPSGPIRGGSRLTVVDVAPSAVQGPWRKIENVRSFAKVRTDPFPTLAFILGVDLAAAVMEDRVGLQAELESFAHGRIVCRTDCRKEGVGRENLPRTNTVSSAAAIDQMMSFLQHLEGAGAGAGDVCFIAHKFIPAHAGAWVRADPASPIVRVDSLWGVPDGLQYLPHDTFEIDVPRQALSAERIRYKPRFIQECEDGSWREVKVRRNLARTRSISAHQAVEISLTSRAIATSVGRPLLVMWFCGIPTEIGVGANLPWFSMAPHPAPTLVGEPVSPRWPRMTIRSLRDLEVAAHQRLTKTVLVLDPELELFRDGAFIEKVISLAKRDVCPVQIAGSALAHAHYQLEKAGITVVPADGTGRTRARGRKSFGKLVRDEIPSQIAGRGEVVVRSRLSKSEMRRGLVAKLHEEAHELLAAVDPDDVKTELADLLEVVRGLANTTGVEWEEVESAAAEKRRGRGGFEGGAVLVKTEWPNAEVTRTREAALVTLRSLGQVRSAPGRVSASYSVLLSVAAGTALTLDGRDLFVRLTREGLILEQMDDRVASPEQTTLPFDDADENRD